MSQEAIQILKELQNSGQTGTLILIIVLLVVIAASIWMIWQQKRAIALVKDSQGAVDQKLKSVESNIKSADSLREESRKSQEMSQKVITDRIDSLVKINDELRKEIDRFDKEQVEFQRAVKEAIDLGIDDLKGRISQVTMREIIEGIPKEFRDDLEVEVMRASERALFNYITKLNQVQFDPSNLHYMRMVIEGYFAELVPRIERRLESTIERHVSRVVIPVSWTGRYGQHEGYLLASNELVERLAERIVPLIMEELGERLARRIAHPIRE